MEIPELFPNAKAIPPRDVRVGDRVAYLNETTGTVTVADIDRVDSQGKLLAKSGTVIRSWPTWFYLIRRAPANLPPAEGGAMIRILNPGQLSEVKPGTIMGCDPAGIYRYGLFHISPQQLVDHLVEWERVWVTNQNPEENVVDADVVEDWSRSIHRLPGKPDQLIEIIDGRHAGAIGRWVPELSLFCMIMPDGHPRSLRPDEVNREGWRPVLVGEHSTYTNPAPEQPF